MKQQHNEEKTLIEAQYADELQKEQQKYQKELDSGREKMSSKEQELGEQLKQIKVSFLAVMMAFGVDDYNNKLMMMMITNERLPYHVVFNASFSVPQQARHGFLCFSLVLKIVGEHGGRLVYFIIFTTVNLFLPSTFINFPFYFLSNLDNERATWR